MLDAVTQNLRYASGSLRRRPRHVAVGRELYTIIGVAPVM